MKLLTLNKKITDRERRSFWLALLFFDLCVQSLEIMGSAWFDFLSLDFFFVLNLLALGICLGKGVFEKKNVYLLGLCFIAWYTVCCFVKGGLSYFRGIGMYTVALLISAWGLALPFVTLTGDFDKKRALNIILSVLTVLLAIAVWAALIPSFMRTSFTLPGSDKVFGILRTYLGWGIRDQYPLIFGMHRFYTAYLSVLAFFMALYLYMQKKMRPLMLFAMLGFVLAISLTKSRLALMSFGLGLFTLRFFLYRDKNRDASPRKTILAGARIALVVTAWMTFLWIFGTLASLYILLPMGGQNDHIWRAFSSRLLDGNGRLELWATIPDMLKGAAPSGYLFGMREDVLYPLIQDSQKMNHMHSGYFSALMLMGIPGFLMSLVFLFKTVKDVLTVFLKMKTHSVSLENLLLLPIPLCFLLAALGEPMLFVGYFFRMNTLVCYLVSGYVFELADRIREEELSLNCV